MLYLDMVYGYEFICIFICIYKYIFNVCIYIYIQFVFIELYILGVYVVINIVV